MKKKTRLLFFLLALSHLAFYCSPSNNFVVLHQVTGPIETNCYLLYDIRSKEAALFDVGGPIDSLITHINNNNLILKYIFATHCHMDHIESVSMIREKFPGALLCYNKEDYENFLISIEWIEKNWDPKELAEMKKDPVLRKWFDYDLSIFGEPDIYLEDNQIYKLGNLKIQTYLSPGHSIGSICYYAGDVLFSGDVLFYRRVGRIDLLGGSNEAMTQSVRRLYDCLPDETKVYPGHGQFTFIGTEKKENEEVTIDSVNL